MKTSIIKQYFKQLAIIKLNLTIMKNRNQVINCILQKQTQFDNK